MPPTRSVSALPLMSGALLLLLLIYAWGLTGASHVDADGESRSQMLLSWDRTALDDFHHSGSRARVAPEIVVLGVDTASLTVEAAFDEDLAASEVLRMMKGNPFPWPRRVWAAVIDKLCEAGANKVFLDFMFSAQSPDPEDDRLLREALARHPGKVVLGAQFDSATVGMGGQNKQLIYPSATVTGKDVPAEGDYGILSFWPEQDGIVRHLHGQVYAWQVAHGVPDVTERPKLSVAAVLAGEKNPPVEQRIRFAPEDAFEPQSLHQIFIPALWDSNFGGGKAFAGKTVLIGATAREMQDIQPTPLGPIFGVLLHAHALNALKVKAFLRDAPRASLWIMLLLGALLAWLLQARVRNPLLNVLLTALLAGGLWFACYRIFEDLHIELSPLPGVLSLSLCSLAALVHGYLQQRKETVRMQRLLQRYTSPEIVKEMMLDRQGLFSALGGIERSVTIFFSDLRGFTSMSEAISATQVVAQLNEYLSSMVECAILQRGLVDKFIGDAVMAWWGGMRSSTTPETLKEDAVRAVTAALNMRAALKLLNVQRVARGDPPWAIGMGIHQDAVVIGNIGSPEPYEKMDITVIGDGVNLASRLEGITKEYGVDLIISQSVRDHVADSFLCRSADLVRPKGKARPVAVYTVLEGPPPAGLAEYEQGMAAYRSGHFAEARKAFDQAAALGLVDTLTQCYQARCTEALDHPPENWDGVYIMTKK
jgi:adenylate cyclase